LALCKILRVPKKLNTLLTLDVLLCDEMGQVSAEFLSIIDIIMRRLRSNNIFLGGLLIICTLDHTQIQPVQGRPFLTSTHIMIPCFKMVSFVNSIRASGDAAFQRIQELARFNYIIARLSACPPTSTAPLSSPAARRCDTSGVVTVQRKLNK
jgi:hypothetical protein